jgi:hypothetical protein
MLQCIKKSTGEFGPVVYGHWSGSDAPIIVERLKARMRTRGADLEYASARLVQDAINGDSGNLSFGLWNADHILTAGDNNEDAGVVLINVDDYSAEYLGGYLAKRATA